MLHSLLHVQATYTICLKQPMNFLLDYQLLQIYIHSYQPEYLSLEKEKNFMLFLLWEEFIDQQQHVGLLNNASKKRFRTEVLDVLSIRFQKAENVN